MKKWFSVLLLAVFLFPSTSLANDTPYVDVSYPSNFEAIYWTKEWGIFSGYAGGYFKGSNEMNRAELAKVLVLGSGVEEADVAACADGATRTFSDVPAAEWYTDYVYCAEAKGWVSGDDGKTTFRPGDPILMGEAFKMLVQSQYGTPDDSYGGAAWYATYVNFLKGYQIIRPSSYSSSDYEFTYMGIGTSDSIGFDGGISSKMRRVDIAELLYRLRVVFEQQDGEPYNLYLSFNEATDLYGTEFVVEEDTLSIYDSSFGFQLEGIPLEDLGDYTVDDLRVFVDGPSAYQNGSYTRWMVMIPDPEGYYNYSGYEYLFYIELEDTDYSPYYSYVNTYDFAEGNIEYTFSCPTYSAYTVEDLLGQLCVVDAEQNVDADYVNFSSNP